MVYVSRNHLFHQLLPDNSLMCPMPATQFIFYIQAQRVTGIKELWVSRIMRQSYCVHVHRLYEFHILYVLFFRQCPAALWPERVSVYSLEYYLASIDIHAVSLTILYGAETEFLSLAVQGLALSVSECEGCLIHLWRFCRP